MLTSNEDIIKTLILRLPRIEWADYWILFNTSCHFQLILFILALRCNEVRHTHSFKMGFLMGTTTYALD